jgi:cell division protein FtsB
MDILRWIELIVACGAALILMFRWLLSYERIETQVERLVREIRVIENSQQSLDKEQRDLRREFQAIKQETHNVYQYVDAALAEIRTEKSALDDLITAHTKAFAQDVFNIATDMTQLEERIKTTEDKSKGWEQLTDEWRAASRTDVKPIKAVKSDVEKSINASLKALRPGTPTGNPPVTTNRDRKPMLAVGAKKPAKKK